MAPVISPLYSGQSCILFVSPGGGPLLGNPRSVATIAGPFPYADAQRTDIFSQPGAIVLVGPAVVISPAWGPPPFFFLYYFAKYSSCIPLCLNRVTNARPSPSKRVGTWIGHTGCAMLVCSQLTSLSGPYPSHFAFRNSYPRTRASCWPMPIIHSSVYSFPYSVWCLLFIPV